MPRYNQNLDRFFHLNGTPDDPCWRALLRGEPVPDEGAGVTTPEPEEAL